MTIRIPPGVRIENKAIGIMGGASVKYHEPLTLDDPVLVIKGVMIMAGYSVDQAKP